MKPTAVRNERGLKDPHHAHGHWAGAGLEISVEEQERDWNRIYFKSWLKGISAAAALLKRGSHTFIKISPTPLTLAAAVLLYALTWVSLLVQEGKQ